MGKLDEMKTKRVIFRFMFVCSLLTALLYLGAAINAPNSGENYGFFIEQSICANGSGPLCRTQDSGVYAIPEVVLKWQCSGEYSNNVECNSQNIDKWANADSFEESRMGRLSYKINGLIIGGNLASGVQRLMLVNSLFVALIICSTYAFLNRRAKIGFIAALTTAALIPENIFHLGSIASIGVTKVSVLSILVISYCLLNKSVSLDYKICGFLVMLGISIGIRRTDQILIVVFLVSGLTAIRIFGAAMDQKTEAAESLVVSECSRAFRILFTLVPGLYVSMQNHEGLQTVRSLKSVVSGGSSVVSGGSSVVSELVHTIYEVIVLPGYLFLDLVPDFWKVNDLTVHIMGVAIAVSIIFSVLSNVKHVLYQREAVLTIGVLILTYLLLGVYGTIFGPRIEIRYIMGFLVFGFFVIYYEAIDLLIERLFKSRLVFIVLLTVQIVGLSSNNTKSQAIYLFNSSISSLTVDFFYCFLLLSVFVVIRIIFNEYENQLVSGEK